MAYKRKVPTIDVNGLSIQDIMNIDVETFNQLGESDLRRITSRLVSASNKRIRALEKRGIQSPAYLGLGTDVRFTTKTAKGTSKQQMANKIRQEFSRARRFLSSKTSSVRGYNEFVKETRRKLSKETGIPISKLKGLNVGDAFKVFHRLQESGVVPPKGSAGSSKMRDYMISQLVDNPDMSDASLERRLTDYDEEMYEEEETGEFDI